MNSQVNIKSVSAGTATINISLTELGGPDEEGTIYYEVNAEVYASSIKDASGLTFEFRFEHAQPLRSTECKSALQEALTFEYTKALRNF